MRADRDTLHRHVEFLTTLRPFRNYRNRGALAKVCDYVKAEFAKYGLGPAEQPFEARGETYKNILATYNRDVRRRLIVGAHYDVCGDQPGADDNASAVAGMLEIARVVALAKPPVDYAIEFVAYCLEEPPFFATDQMGSHVHAKALSQSGTKVVGVINFEMIGYFHDGPQPYPYPWLKERYPPRANFIAVVGKQTFHDFNQRVFELMKEDAGIDVQMIDDPRVEHVACLSDHSSYWPLGIPALMVNDTSFIRNPHYHQMSDDIDTLDFDRMAEAVSCVYKAVVGL